MVPTPGYSMCSGLIMLKNRKDRKIEDRKIVED
jgi:hypothetical protein